MRLAEVVPAGAHPQSGVPAAIRQIAVHLARRGHHVELWLLRESTGESSFLNAPDLISAGVEVVSATGSVWRRTRTLAQREVDVVHLHSVFTLPNALLAEQIRAPYAVSPHGGYAPASLARSSVRKKIYALLVERRLLRRAAVR